MSTVALIVTNHFAGGKKSFSRRYTVSNRDLPSLIEGLQGILVRYPKQIRMGTTTEGPTTLIDIEIGALSPRPAVRAGRTFEQLYGRDQEAS